MSNEAASKSFYKILSKIIFFSRLLQAPLYLGLIVAQFFYAILFFKELWHLIFGIFKLNEQHIMLFVLGLVDIIMISNLLTMVIVGGYQTFVSKLGLDDHPDRPEWLGHVNSGILKVKLAMAIVGISSIHLLKTFIEANSVGLPLCRTNEGFGNICAEVTPDGVMWQSIIHGLFVLSAIGIAYTDKMISSTAANEHPQ